MTAAPLCITCGHWQTTIGDQCDTCRGPEPVPNLIEQALAESPAEAAAKVTDYEAGQP